MPRPTSKGSSTRKGPNVWVVRCGRQFSIKEERRPGYLILPVSQRVAINLARQIARINKSELIVQAEHGHIRIKDSHGFDSFPPKG